ncbi:MAG: S8 family serine peptidase [Solirubrobacteraceae bacterium]
MGSGAAVALCILCAPAHAAFPDTPPNDPLFDANPLPNWANEQWDLASPAAGFDRGISVDRAWPLTTGEGAIVADIDVGVRLDHPDLAGRWALNPGEAGGRAHNGIDDDLNGYVDDWRGWDFYAGDADPTSDTANAHGTNVAGVLAAAADNGEGIAGVAPGARILPLRTSDNILHQGARVAEAIVYAADRGASAISMSLGAESFGANLRRAVAYANRRGAVMAVASGNEFHFHHHYPQVLEDVLAVGGLNPDSANLAARDGNLALTGNAFDVKAAYGDYGPHLDVVAPTQVFTTEWGGGYRRNWDGTSAATPHVAAVAALVAARGRALRLGLSADEVIQIIRMSADDLTNAGQGYGPGWDRLSGYGRVNAFAAVSRAAAGRIPPVAKIATPSWYRPVRGTVLVHGDVHGRAATTWRLEIGAGEQPASWRLLASGTGTRGPDVRRLARVDTAALPAGGHTLRLRATDAGGNTGEGRSFMTVQHDPSLKPGLPQALATSGESSPALADVNRDGVSDIVLATADGFVRVLSGRSGRVLPGWPRAMIWEATPPSLERALGGRLRRGFLATPAIGDIGGSARVEIVAAGLDGRVYAWDSRGRIVRGFPVEIGIRRPADRGRLDAAIFASPALADLSGDGRLDIVVGAADQRIYAWDGAGRPLPGWPVLARDEGAGGDVTKILSSPAIGDLDGDGSPEVVEGTGEAYGATPSTSGRVYAWDARGRRKPGWPVAPGALAADSIPIAGEGVPVSPSLADIDGDGRDEVAVAAFTGQPELYRGDGSRIGGQAAGNHFQTTGTGGAGQTTSAPSVLALGANAAFGRTAPGGTLRFFGGVVDARLALAQAQPASRVDFDHVLGGWEAGSGAWLPAFPIRVEGWQLPSSPAIADVDGDDRAEVIAGSSGNRLHAFRADGSEPAGWPKDTGGWLLASPAVADVDGDGRLDVVAVTRDGFLFAWDTAGRATGTAEWPAFRHDVRNTGRYGAVVPGGPVAGGRPRLLLCRVFPGGRCARRAVRATVVGLDAPDVLSVTFRAGRRVAGDRAFPFTRRLGGRLLGAPGARVALRAQAVLEDGRRLTLVRRVTLCR